MQQTTAFRLSSSILIVTEKSDFQFSKFYDISRGLEPNIPGSKHSTMIRINKNKFQVVLYSCCFVLYSCCLLLYSCCFVLCLLSRVVLCCTCVVSHCVVFYSCFVELSRVVPCCYSCGFLDWIHICVCCC